MKPPIEYRPKRAKSLAGALRTGKPAPLAQAQMDAAAKRLLDEYIVIRRDRAKYNAYMRAYRAKKKAAKP